MICGKTVCNILLVLGLVRLHPSSWKSYQMHISIPSQKFADVFRQWNIYDYHFCTLLRIYVHFWINLSEKFREMHILLLIWSTAQDQSPKSKFCLTEFCIHVYYIYIQNDVPMARIIISPDVEHLFHYQKGPWTWNWMLYRCHHHLSSHHSCNSCAFWYGKRNFLRTASARTQGMKTACFSLLSGYYLEQYG